MTPVQIRWIVRRDYEEVLAIEQASFASPWTMTDVLTFMSQRNNIGMVAEFQEKIVGYFLYELHKEALRVVDFAVAPAFRREGVGRQMVARLLRKLSQQRRTEVVLEVSERNLAAQVFFRKMGFLAVGVLKNFYKDCDDDG